MSIVNRVGESLQDEKTDPEPYESLCFWGIELGIT